jgi:hypothetical protein
MKLVWMQFPGLCVGLGSVMQFMQRLRALALPLHRYVRVFFFLYTQCSDEITLSSSLDGDGTGLRRG